jgi:plasmid stabilization system protein ParE
VSFRYRLSPAAVEDMEGIIDYLRERNPVAAVRFVEAAQATFEHVAFMPLAYPTMRTERPALAGVSWRPLTGAFDRYLVFYRVTDDDFVSRSTTQLPSMHSSPSPSLARTTYSSVMTTEATGPRSSIPSFAAVDLRASTRSPT